MNKLETFFENLTLHSEVYCDDFVLAFFLSDGLQIVFTKDDNKPFCYLDIIWEKDSSYKTKFEFNIPVCYIYDFIGKNTSNGDKKHFLINNYSSVISDKTVNSLYDELIEAFDVSEHVPIKSKAFQVILESALVHKVEYKKKQKI